MFSSSFKRTYLNIWIALSKALLFMHFFAYSRCLLYKPSFSLYWFNFLPLSSWYPVSDSLQIDSFKLESWWSMFLAILTLLRLEMGLPAIIGEITFGFMFKRWLFFLGRLDAVHVTRIGIHFMWLGQIVGHVWGPFFLINRARFIRILFWFVGSWR